MTIKRFFAQFKIRDLGHLLLATLIFIPAIIMKIFLRNYWLISENKNEARDNGYWLFKYVKENHPELKCYYAINKKAPDYQKIKNYHVLFRLEGFHIGFGILFPTRIYHLKKMVLQTHLLSIFLK